MTIIGSAAKSDTMPGERRTPVAEDTNWFARVPAAAIFDPVLQRSREAFLVFSVLCAHANAKTNVATVKMITIADEAGLLRKNIPRALKLIEDRGHIRRIRTYKGGRFGINTYEIVAFAKARAGRMAEVVSSSVRTPGPISVLTDEDTKARRVSSPMRTGCPHPRGSSLTDQLTERGAAARAPQVARAAARSEPAPSPDPATPYVPAVVDQLPSGSLLPAVALIGRLIEMLGPEAADPLIKAALSAKADGLSELRAHVEAAEASNASASRTADA